MLREAVTIDAASVWAALPALPLGKGATILILGGIFALVVSLTWTLFSPRGAPVPAARAVRPPVPIDHGGRRVVPSALTHPRFEMAAPSGVDMVFQEVRPDWVEQTGRVTEQMGFGTLQVVSIAEGVCRVRLTRCASCRNGSARAGCEAEAHALRCALEHSMPDPLVREVSCRGRRETECVFEVLPGGRE